MDKVKLKILLDIVVIILILAMCIVMLNLTSLIKSEGGTCTASPKAYLEQKLQEQYNKEYACVCKPPEFNPMAWKSNISIEP